MRSAYTKITGNQIVMPAPRVVQIKTREGQKTKYCLGAKGKTFMDKGTFELNPLHSWT
jgi:hypothetical protein